MRLEHRTRTRADTPSEAACPPACEVLSSSLQIQLVLEKTQAVSLPCRGPLAGLGGTSSRDSSDTSQNVRCSMRLAACIVRTSVQHVLGGLRIDSVIRSQADPPLRRAGRSCAPQSSLNPRRTLLHSLVRSDLPCLPVSHSPASHGGGHGAQIPPVVGSARPSILPFREQVETGFLRLFVAGWPLVHTVDPQAQILHPLASWSIPQRCIGTLLCQGHSIVAPVPEKRRRGWGWNKRMREGRTTDMKSRRDQEAKLALTNRPANARYSPVMRVLWSCTGRQGGRQGRQTRP